MEKTIELSLVCDRCGCHQLYTEFVDDCWFVICDECGFDREATDDDFMDE